VLAHGRAVVLRKFCEKSKGMGPYLRERKGRGTMNFAMDYQSTK
jgi:hypothetical protein